MQGDVLPGERHRDGAGLGARSKPTHQQGMERGIEQRRVDAELGRGRPGLRERDVGAHRVVATPEGGEALEGRAIAVATVGQLRVNVLDRHRDRPDRRPWHRLDRRGVRAGLGGECGRRVPDPGLLGVVGTVVAVGLRASVYRDGAGSGLLPRARHHT